MVSRRFQIHEGRQTRGGITWNKGRKCCRTGRSHDYSHIAMVFTDVDDKVCDDISLQGIYILIDLSMVSSAGEEQCRVKASGA